MTTLFGFVVGYIVGARAGNEGWARVERALRDIKESDEFRNLLAVLRDHIRGTVQIVNDRLAAEDFNVVSDLEALAARARARVTASEAE